MLAEHDEELDDKADIALGSTKNLVTGKYARDLCETVWDMELLEWDWDKSSSWTWNKNTKLTYEKDGTIFYYKDKREEAKEMTEAEKEAERKRAIIHKRKKVQATKARQDGHETGVVMRTQARAEDSSGSGTGSDKKEGVVLGVVGEGEAVVSRMVFYAEICAAMFKSSSENHLVGRRTAARPWWYQLCCRGRRRKGSRRPLKQRARCRCRSRAPSRPRSATRCGR